MGQQHSSFYIFYVTNGKVLYMKPLTMRKKSYLSINVPGNIAHNIAKFPRKIKIINSNGSLYFLKSIEFMNLITWTKRDNKDSNEWNTIKYGVNIDIETFIKNLKNKKNVKLHIPLHHPDSGCKMYNFK